MNLLPDLLARVYEASDQSDLRARLFPAATQFFGARRGALFLFSEMPDKTRFERSPFALALLERHAPLHDGQIASAREWQATHSRADHGHVLAGPIVQNGELVGVLAFTRAFNDAAFNDRNVSDLSALCLHVSTRMASWTSTSGPDRACLLAPTPIETSGKATGVALSLSPREREIVALVAQGKTNAQIGRELFVSGETVKANLKAVFRKTGVQSRAQLVAVATGSRTQAKEREA